MSQKIFDNDLVEILKSKVILTLNKSAYVGICILALSKALMFEFHYNYININTAATEACYLQTLIA